LFSRKRRGANVAIPTSLKFSGAHRTNLFGGAASSLPPVIVSGRAFALFAA
jgi:hypothetical protein